MSTELARRTDVVSNLDDVQRVAKLLAVSGYFEAKGASDQAIAQLATKVLAGREMGFSPFASVQGIHIIQGKPTVSANLMAAAVKGSAKYDYRIREHTDTMCRIEFFERMAGKLESLGVSTFGIEDARRAGTQNMSKFPKNMLFARCMSNGVRFYCPDVFSTGVYTPEEMGATVNGDGEIVDVQATVVQPMREEPPAEEPVWADWRGPVDARAWADEQGLADVGDQYDALKSSRKWRNAQEFYQAWVEHVTTKLAAQADADANANAEQPVLVLDGALPKYA